MLWAVRSDLAFSPTPTPTATAAPPRSPTPDFRATRVVEDMLTQTAHQAALQGTRTPIPPDMATVEAPGSLFTQEPSSEPPFMPTRNVVMLPGIVASMPTPSPTVASLIEVAATPTAIIVSLPIGMAGSPLATATAPEQVSILPTAVPPPPPTEMPTDVPPVVLPVDTPTFTPELPTPEPPTPTQPPTDASPTPTAMPYLVSSLRANIQNADTVMRLGPSIIYTNTGTIAANSEVRLLGRNPSGEWVYACCLDNAPGWVRQAFAIPTGNTFGDATLDAENNPNDVRWLAVQPVASILHPIPPPTAVPADDYPLYRYLRDAQGRLPHIPVPPVNFAWPSPAQASLPLISPATVAGPSVLVASADAHLYSFDRQNGNQRWRINLGQPVRQAPTVLGSDIFVADDTGRLLALEDRGNEAAPIWNTGAGLPPVTSFNIFSDTLFIGMGQGEAYELFAVDSDNGAVLDRYAMPGSPLRYPAVGDQLVYVAGGHIEALDVFTREPIWKREDLTNITAGPVYVSPGVRGQAELYVVLGDNRIFCLDANTGSDLWNADNGEVATGLALNDRTLLVWGNGYVKAITRDTREQIWRSPTPGLVLAVWADNQRILALTQNGSLQFMDAAGGTTLGGAAISANAAGAGAVGGAWVFIPGIDGSVYALRGTP